MGKLKNVETNVEKILKYDEESRSNDSLLITVYLHQYHGVTTLKEYCNCEEAPALESITRARRIIQARGNYKATERVQAAREQRQEEFYNYSLE